MLIEKFEKHPDKESFLQDFKQTKEINEFSKDSQDLVADMNNTEISILVSRHCILFVRKMLKNIAKCKGGRQE